MLRRSAVSSASPSAHLVGRIETTRRTRRDRATTCLFAIFPDDRDRRGSGRWRALRHRRRLAELSRRSAPAPQGDVGRADRRGRAVARRPGARRRGGPTTGGAGRRRRSTSSPHAAQARSCGTAAPARRSRRSSCGSASTTTGSSGRSPSGRSSASRPQHGLAVTGSSTRGRGRRSSSAKVAVHEGRDVPTADAEELARSRAGRRHDAAEATAPPRRPARRRRRRPARATLGERAARGPGRPPRSPRPPGLDARRRLRDGHAGEGRADRRFGEDRGPGTRTPASTSPRPPGTPVQGRVVRPRRRRPASQSGYGNLVCIEHAGGKTTCYAHLSTINAADAASAVESGQVIGTRRLHRQLHRPAPALRGPRERPARRPERLRQRNPQLPRGEGGTGGSYPGADAHASALPPPPAALRRRRRPRRGAPRRRSGGTEWQGEETAAYEPAAAPVEAEALRRPAPRGRGRGGSARRSGSRPGARRRPGAGPGRSRAAGGGRSGRRGARAGRSGRAGRAAPVVEAALRPVAAPAPAPAEAAPAAPPVSEEVAPAAEAPAPVEAAPPPSRSAAERARAGRGRSRRPRRPPAERLRPPLPLPRPSSSRVCGELRSYAEVLHT